MQSVTLDGPCLPLKQGKPPTSCKPGEVVVQVHAIALSPFEAGLTYDLGHRLGISKRKQGIGSSFAGEITYVGAADSSPRILVGDEVVGFVLNPFSDFTFSTHIVVRESVCCRKPIGLSRALAVSAVTDFMIAERTLRLAKASERDSILITGGASPLTKTLIELAKSSMFGVEWVASTVSCMEDRIYSESIGADEVFDTTCNGGRWSRIFEAGANKKDYDIVIDVVGDWRNAKTLLKKNTGRWTCLLKNPTPEEILDYNIRVGRNVISTLRTSVVGKLFTGCSGRRENGNFSVIPTGNGELLERFFVLLETGILSPSLERVVAPGPETESAISSLKHDPFGLRGRLVVEF